MGYAKIQMGIATRRIGRFKVRSSEQVIIQMEKQLKNDRIPFVEESRAGMLIIKWGNDLKKKVRL